MEKLVFSVYDMQANIYKTPFLYDDERLAIANIRRDVRDMYLKKETTFDTLSDLQFCLIAKFDTETGEYSNDVDKNKKIRLTDFVGDLVMPNEV